MSAANVSKAWIGLEAEQLFERALGRDIHFVNDADAAGFAEDHYGAAKDASGLVIMTTLGTGIGGAFIYNGVLIPNAELGHLGATVVALREVVLEAGPLEVVERVDGVGPRELVQVTHEPTPIRSRRRISPSRIRVLAVPNGTSSRVATSVCV